jgi:hypothetical protein
VLSDGTFDLEIAAEIGDRIQIRIRDTANNEILLEEKPFTSADGQYVVFDSRANKFTNIEGLGIEIEAGTFSAAVQVGVIAENNPAVLAAMPDGRLSSETDPFGASTTYGYVSIGVFFYEVNRRIYLR